MKTKILFAIILLCISDLCYAQSSSLSIVSESELFVLYLNGINVNSMANTVAVVDGLKIGSNHVRLAFARKGVPELNARLELADDGKIHQLAYKVIKDGKGKQILQFISDNSMSLSEQDSEPSKQPVNTSQKPATAKKPAASNDKHVKQPEKISSTVQTEEGKADIQVTVSQNGMSMNMQIPDDKNEVEVKKEPVLNKVPGVNDGLMCSNPTVDGQTLLKFKYKISSVNMEVYKAKDIKDFMNNNCMLASQVADLVKMVQMNDYQYDVAQLGYLRTYDQANYQVVINALMADFNKEKLLNFISSNSTNVNQSPSTTKKTNNEVIKEETFTPSQPPTSTYNGTSSTSTTCIPMNANDFDEALGAVDEPINEDNKMEVAKSIFDQECLNTNQVYRVLELFINEDRKLDFAKFAFSRTSDKDKYFRLNKAFINEGRVTELSNYVKKNR